MSRSFPRFFSLLLIVLYAGGLILPQETVAQEKKRYANVRDALATARALRGASGPQNVNWIDNGSRYSYTERNKDGAMEIRVYDPASGEDKLLFRNTDHTFPDTDNAFNYSSFQFSQDSKYLVFQSNFRPVYRNSGIADYYLYSIEKETLELLVSDARTAELSPDGTKIGYERNGDLFVYDLNRKKERQLTDSGKEYFYNGRYGWVYEEEFGLTQAWKWSNDSKHIAYWQVDEREVPVFQMTDYEGQHPEYVKLPYPQVGDTNPTVKIGVVNIRNGKNKWMDVDMGDGYVPRIYWTADDNSLAIVHLNRAQNHLKLTFHDIKSGKGRLVLEEQSEAWIDVFDFFAGIMDLFFFPEDAEEFFWISDRDGWSHIYRYDYEGNLINQVTEGEWEVTYVHTVNYEDNRVYYISTEESPLERHLYSITFDGKDKRKLTEESGRHHINMGPNARYYIDSWSNTETPRQVELWETGKGMAEKLENNASVTKFIEEYVYAPRELFSFTTSDGQKLDGYIIKPIDFNPDEQYPLLLNIYGGPGAQGVYNEFEASGWDQYLAQEGYVIVNVNNRGSGGYGSEFEEIVYKQLGKWEAHDFVETVKYMAEKSWVDGEHMAMRGHSYGGYITSYTLFTHPDVFKAGISAAPVTDWRLYDSIYAERYMGLLDNNLEGYEQSASTTHAGNLNDEFLLVHSTMDENVHVQNTMQLATALAAKGIDADLRIYPPGAHGVSFNAPSYFLLYETYTDFLNEHLK